MATVNINIFEERNAYATLLAVFELKKPDKSAIYKFITGKSHHIKSIDQRIKTFEDHGLIITEEEKTVPPHTWVELTPKGMNIARRLAYAFDLEKEVIQLPKSLTDELHKLKEYDIIRDVEEVCIDAIKTKITKFEKQYK